MIHVNPAPELITLKPLDMPPNATLSIVVPCFNEAAGLDAFFARLEPVLMQLEHYHCQIICVDDGSSDATLALLLQHAQRNPQIQVLELSRNFGKECALTAGLDAARGNAIIPIDADLQHPPEVIPELVRQWESGFDMVLAKRISRATDHPLQRYLTERFYQWHNKMSECEIPVNVGDFRLFDRCVLEALKQLPERRRFMKGLFAWVGFRQTTVEFDVEPRRAGRSSFNARRLWRLALDGITSFSTVPLSVWAYFGTLMASLSFFYGGWIVLKTLVYGIDVPGYASILTAVLFLGGVQLIGIGVLGEYIGRIYSESKQRPIYIVRKTYGRENKID